MKFISWSSWFTVGMIIISSIFQSTRIFAQTSSNLLTGPKWGKVICEAVTQDEALKFAMSGLMTPHYGTPIGTLSCSLPLKVWEIDGGIYSDPSQKTYSLDVYFVGAPMILKDCQVSYFDTSILIRTFPAKGIGHGYVNLVQGMNSFNLSFQDLSLKAKSVSDDFVIIELGTQPTLAWVNEQPGLYVPNSPFVSKCHIELPQ